MSAIEKLGQRRALSDSGSSPSSSAFPLQKVCHGIHVPLDLRGNVLRIQAWCGNVTISCSLTGIVEITKQLSNVGKAVLFVQLVCGVTFSQCFLEVISPM